MNEEGTEEEADTTTMVVVEVVAGKIFNIKKMHFTPNNKKAPIFVIKTE
jgi:hypothetical protein